METKNREVLRKLKNQLLALPGGSEAIALSEVLQRMEAQESLEGDE